VCACTGEPFQNFNLRAGAHHEIGCGHNVEIDSLFFYTLLAIHAAGGEFSVTFASNTVDSSLVYRLKDRTNLLKGAVNTNGWGARTYGVANGDYLTVSNHYPAASADSLFISLSVERP